jgi:hypothetical protein
MTMQAQFAMIEKDHKHNIIFIEDIANHTGGITITNDAEAVHKYIDYMHSHDAPTPSFWRIVYKDTNNEWWEMIPRRQSRLGTVHISFEKWHSHEWDALKGKV